MTAARRAGSKRWKGVAALLLAVALVFALGPRARMDIRLTPIDLPEDLESWLAASEARFTDLRADAGKRIVWTDPARKARTPYAVVYVHGFSATRMETAPLAGSIASRLGANLFETRLAGHGRSDDALGEATLSAWLDDVREAHAIGRRLGERVVMIGTSTGATLVTWFATRPEASDLGALVLISPNYGVRQWNASLILWPWGEQIGRWMEGDYHVWQAVNAGQAANWTMRQPIRSLIPLMQSVKLADTLDLSTVKTPTQVFYSPQDRVVDPARIERRFADFGASAKSLVPVEGVGDPQQHVLAGDILSPGTTAKLAEAVAAFVRTDRR